MTDINTLGEFGLLERLTGDIDNRDDVIMGIGDDCAVIEGRDGKYGLVTTDMLVSGDHFRTDWHTPWQIGWKSMIVNVSDIASMGGSPDYAVISMSLPYDMEVEFIEGVFRGMKAACKKYGVDIIGGDTTHGDTLVINVAMIGHVEPENLCLRGDAKLDDKICLTGDLGKSWAGLDLLLAGKEGYTDFYLEPDCRLDISRKLAPHINAMIDVSDGLASEITHICKSSGLGAEIYSKDIPISRKTREAGELLNKDPIEWALSGGEDFELLFTVSKEKLKELDGFDYLEIGTIVKDGIRLVKEDGVCEVLKGGYDHFNR